MKKKSTNTVKSYDSFYQTIRYIMAFFAAMMGTYICCLCFEEVSVWFCLTFAVAAGILALCVCHTISSDGKIGGKNFYIWMSALLAFFAISICYMGLGVYPFGEKSVMIIDMHHQYSSFFSLVREKITSFESLSYSDSVGMGAGLIPLIAYYLCSPYNIIAVIFPREFLTEAIALIEILKITTASATFAIFCRGVFKKNDYGTVAVSVAYAMSAYFIAYSWDVMWLDCLVLLPLIVYGLEKVLNGKSPLLYCITLGLAITTNYYIGYMICIFMVMWFVMRLITESTGLDIYAIGKKFFRFAWTSVVGGMLSMWILVPTAISLSATSGADDQFARDITNNFNFWDIFSRMLYNNTPTERGDNLPNIYCSILAVFMIAVFCFCRKIKLKTRVGFMGLLGVLVISLSNNWLNFAFHGFHFPNDLPYRNSFLISFVMLCIAVQAIDKLNKIDSATVVKSFSLIAAMLILEEQFGVNGSKYEIIWYSIGFLCVYAAISGLKTSGRLKSAAALILTVAVVFVEVATNSVSMIKQLNQNEVFTDRANFVYDYNVNKAAVNAVDEINDDGSRMEILPRKTCNDNALYNYSGLTVFASSNAESTTTLMGKLGYAINGVNSYIYNSYVPLIDSMLNVRYIAFDHDIGNHRQLSYVKSVTDGNGNYRYIYENTLALSRGFAVSSDILYWDTADELNPFSVQDKFVEYATGCEPVYTMLSPTVESTGNMNVEFSQSNFYAELLTDATGSFTALQTIEKEAQTYIYVDCRAASGITVWVGDSSWTVTTYEPYIIDLGKLNVGTEIRVQITSQMSCSGNVFIASMDTDKLDAAISALGKNQWNITEYKDGYFKGDITADSDSIMFTSIPYNAGWDVYVDGEKVEAEKIGDALMGVPLTAGTHTVEMKYHTDGFPLGFTMTILGVILLVLWVMRKKTVYPLLKEFVPVLYDAIDSKETGEAIPAPARTTKAIQKPDIKSDGDSNAPVNFESDELEEEPQILSDESDGFEITEDNL